MGIFSRQLLDQGIAERAVCVDPNYAEEKTETHNGKQISFVRQDKNGYNLVLMMDVLEHVPDDVALLKEYGDQMPKGGHVLITVPASSSSSGPGTTSSSNTTAATPRRWSRTW